MREWRGCGPGYRINRPIMNACEEVWGLGERAYILLPLHFSVDHANLLLRKTIEKNSKSRLTSR